MNVHAGETSTTTALTIYSTAQPGAISPDLYRPGGLANFGRGFARQIPGYAVVKQERDINLANVVSTIRFSDVAAQIDPTTVTFASLTDPEGTHVLEQNFQFDLVSTAKLMERFIDRPISVEQSLGDSMVTFSGTLLSTAGGLVLRQDDGSVQVINGYSNVRFPELPGGLITRPTLVWQVATGEPGAHRVRVTYETAAITWWADYNLVFAEGQDANSGTLDISAWASILNQSGATYRNAKLKLIAGEVHRAPRPEMKGRGMLRSLGYVDAELAPAGFKEKSFFEYHLYTLGRPTTLPDNSTKQIELFPPVPGVTCERVLVYYGLANRYWGYGTSAMTDRNYGTQGNTKVDTYLQFENSEANGMGMPLPSGRVRVSKLDPEDQSLEFIGEDVIDHTPKDETVLIKMGSAFDVVGERKQIDFAVDTRRRTMDEEIEIKIRNHKDERVSVIVKENLYRWANWNIARKTHAFKKMDSRTIHFPVDIKKDGEVTIRYTVHYSW
ncbi:MAG: DUF4139 domain-containing protein [Planctomycetes bacterium]|nr:DUF4139 domain-containing protein [Planctomycetota bacterium]